MPIFDDEKQNRQLEDLRMEEEEDLVKILAQSKYNLPYINLYQTVVDNEALRAIPEKEGREMNVAPFKLFGKNKRNHEKEKFRARFLYGFKRKSGKSLG